MFKKVKAAAEYTFLAYTAIMSVKGLIELGIDATDYVKDKVKNRQKD